MNGDKMQAMKYDMTELSIFSIGLCTLNGCISGHRQDI